MCMVWVDDFNLGERDDVRNGMLSGQLHLSWGGHTTRVHAEE
jgi:hypothetical protein